MSGPDSRTSGIPPQHSLVLYKNRPARVLLVADKLEIGLQGGATQRVRPKDVLLLHPGPLHDLQELIPQAGDVESACEILAGIPTTLAELADLIYGEYSPASAWAAWQLVAEGLYFQGTPEEVVARPLAEVTRERTLRAAREAEGLAWQQFLERVQSGAKVLPEDAPFLEEVEALALYHSSQSRLLRKLGHQENPESAHSLLLSVGHWDATTNPYPERLHLASDPPAIELPPLPAESRRDLTHLPAFAIDDEGNVDPDDAISLEGDRLWVHVADVAALVPPDSTADLEARARSATLYLPERMVPMLPPGANGELGLGLKEVSPALSFGLDLTPEGEVKEVEIVPSWVRVQRVTYTEVETRLQEEPFRDFWRWASLFRERRMSSGAILLTFPEVKIRVQGGKVDIFPIPPLESRTLVSEAMLMAGGAVARFAQERGIPFPFATQAAPEISGQPTTLAEMYALRKKLQRRQMKSTPQPHAGVGLPVYSQVTSPLRRYLDLVVHQQLRAYLRGEDLLEVAQVVERIGAVEAVSGNVRRGEQLSNRHWTLVYLSRNPQWGGAGILVDRRDQRGTLLIPDLNLEIQMYIQGEPESDRVVPLVLQGVDLPRLEAHFRQEGRRRK